MPEWIVIVLNFFLLATAIAGLVIEMRRSKHS
jgi:hypothetical protein